MCAENTAVTIKNMDGETLKDSSSPDRAVAVPVVQWCMVWYCHVDVMTRKH